MNQKTLYLKYRPQTLGEIVGQEELVGVLERVVKNDNPAHAYLFCGGRGTGKTTTARAFAKALNIAVDDIIELDAASNNGVDEVRSLTESVNTLPYSSKYKMYILDEVHMFSKAASNAFLKTLEEPPAHVIFVLCTTDPEKLPDTILSRCIKFSLKSPNLETLQRFIKTVCEKESVKVEREAMNLIALSGDGSYRDSLSNLQKVLSFTEDKGILKVEQIFTEEFVSKILGIPATSAIFLYLKSLDGISDTQTGVEVLKNLEKQRVDNILFAKELTYYARILLLFRHGLIKEEEIKQEFGEHILEFLNEFKTHKTPKINSGMLAKIIDAEINSKNSSLPFLSYELLFF